MEANPLRTVDIRQHNRNLILSGIYRSRLSGGASQSDLVKTTGLKAPSVFRIFSSLEDEGLIRPCIKATMQNDSKKGRKPLRYTVCPGALYTIGVEFWASCISLGVFDFNGSRVFCDLFNIPSDFDIDHVVSQIVVMVNSAIAAKSIEREKIIGVGVAAAGKVDVHSGVIVYYHRIKGISNYPLMATLSKALDLPVLVHNNCSAFAFDTYNHSNLKDGSLFTFLLRSGVNGTLVGHRERIFLESDGTNFEAGHLPLDFDGPLCTCGLRGCLQAYLFEVSREFDGQSDENSLFFNLEKPLIDGDPKALEIVRRAALYMYSSIKCISRFIAPSAYMIVCLSDVVAENIASEITRLLSQENDSLKRSTPSIFHEEYDNLHSQRGMSDMLLEQFFAR